MPGLARWSCWLYQRSKGVRGIGRVTALLSGSSFAPRGLVYPATQANSGATGLTFEIRFAPAPGRYTFSLVSKLLRAMSAAALVLYGLALSHCTLEQFPLFEFLACCDHPDSAPHQDNDCQSDACSVVESGLYKTTDRYELLPVVSLMLANLAQHLESELTLIPCTAPLRSCSPPELSQTWQFCFRAAQPPRAPSFVS